MSNYPPGVSGREFAIAGPDREFEEERECRCGYVGEALIQSYGLEQWWTCPECGEDHIEEDEYEDDPDRFRDEELDREERDD